MRRSRKHEFGFQSIDEWMNTLSLTEIIRQVGMKSGAAVGKIWGAAPQIASVRSN